MKIFLQNCKTAEFIRCDSEWTLDVNEALDFLSVRRAVSFGMMQLKTAFQVVRCEPNRLPCAVIFAMSNLLWPEGSQLALKISVKRATPGSKAGHAPFLFGSNPPHRVLALAEEPDIPQSTARALVGSGLLELTTSKLATI